MRCFVIAHQLFRPQCQASGFRWTLQTLCLSLVIFSSTANCGAATGMQRDIDGDRSTSGVHSALVEIFDKAVLADNARVVCGRANALPQHRRFEFLKNQVLHGGIGLVAEFARGSLDSGADRPFDIFCPALDLIAAANHSNRLEELRTDVLGMLSQPVTDRDAATGRSLLFLLELQAGDLESAERQLNALESRIGNAFVAPSARPALLLCAWAGRGHVEFRRRFSEILAEEHSRVVVDQRARDARSSDHWTQSVAALNGLYSHLVSGGTLDTFGTTPAATNWFPTTVETHATRRDAWLPSHWSVQGDVAQDLANNGRGLLFYRIPLTGDFEVSCEISTYSYQRVAILFGGQSLLPTVKGYGLVTDNLRVQTVSEGSEHGFEAGLANPLQWVRCRIRCRDGLCSTSFNGKVVQQRPVNPADSPWLAIQCESPFHGAVRRLRILGEPVVPEVVSLISRQLNGWYPYFSESVGGGPNDSWNVGDDGTGALTVVGQDDIELAGTNADRLLT